MKLQIIDVTNIGDRERVFLLSIDAKQCIRATADDLFRIARFITSELSPPPKISVAPSPACECLQACDLIEGFLLEYLSSRHRHNRVDNAPGNGLCPCFAR